MHTYKHSITVTTKRVLTSVYRLVEPECILFAMVVNVFSLNVLEHEDEVSHQYTLR